MTILGWTQTTQTIFNNFTYPQPVGTHMDTPILSLREIGQVFLLRSKGPIGDDAPSSFRAAVFSFHPALDQNKAKVARSPLAAYGVEIDVVMHDILVRDDFMEEPQLVIDLFIHGITVLVSTLGLGKNSSDAKRYMERIRQRVPEVAQHLWDNRERLELWDPQQQVTIRDNPICPFLLTYYRQAECNSRILSQLLLYVWVFAPFPGAELGELLYLHATHSITCRAYPDTTAEHNAYLRTAILSGIGPDAFISRIKGELQRTGISQEHLGSCLSVTHDLERLPEFIPYIEGYDLLGTMLRTMEYGGHCGVLLLHQRFPLPPCYPEIFAAANIQRFFGRSRARYGG
ncbi:unnamed protein product [Peniophora sp. CBMAI 1063]|nr:unnamed protein product [Peniophora sp. CBMAI 1063]